MKTASSMSRNIVPDVDAIAAAADPSTVVVREAARLAPIVWMIGKVQSGKTSIVRAITHSSEAEIGNGFKACTSTARVFDFPSDAPILRFLDTRGIGEVAYDPTEDLHFAESRAQVILVTMRAMDMAQDAVIAVVAAVRKRHPSWPVVVAQTCLHEGYGPNQTHAIPYPFADSQSNQDVLRARFPDLWRCLRHQRTLKERLPGKAPVVFVPIDFTAFDDAMPPAEYGMDALCDALIQVVPETMRAAVLTLPSIAIDEHARLADPIIMGHAMAAAGSDLVPVPGAGAVAVSAIQARLLQRLGQIHGVSWDRRALAELATALGSGVAVRTLVGMGARQLVKLIPIYGQTIAAATSAAMSFAVTFALGKAASHFLTRRQRGLKVEGTAQAYQDALREALRMAKDRNFAKATSEGTDRKPPPRPPS